MYIQKVCDNSCSQRLAHPLVCLHLRDIFFFSYLSPDQLREPVVDHGPSCTVPTVAGDAIVLTGAYVTVVSNRSDNLDRLTLSALREWVKISNSGGIETMLVHWNKFMGLMCYLRRPFSWRRCNCTVSLKFMKMATSENLIEPSFLSLTIANKSYGLRSTAVCYK